MHLRVGHWCTYSVHADRSINFSKLAYYFWLPEATKYVYKYQEIPDSAITWCCHLDVISYQFRKTKQIQIPRASNSNSSVKTWYKLLPDLVWLVSLANSLLTMRIRVLAPLLYRLYLGGKAASACTTSSWLDPGLVRLAGTPEAVLTTDVDETGSEMKLK